MGRTGQRQLTLGLREAVRAGLETAERQLGGLRSGAVLCPAPGSRSAVGGSPQAARALAELGRELPSAGRTTALVVTSLRSLRGAARLTSLSLGALRQESRKLCEEGISRQGAWGRSLTATCRSLTPAPPAGGHRLGSSSVLPEDLTSALQRAGGATRVLRGLGREVRALLAAFAAAGRGPARLRAGIAALGAVVRPALAGATAAVSELCRELREWLAAAPAVQEAATATARAFGACGAAVDDAVARLARAAVLWRRAATGPHTGTAEADGQWRRRADTRWASASAGAGAAPTASQLGGIAAAVDTVTAACAGLLRLMASLEAGVARLAVRARALLLSVAGGAALLLDRAVALLGATGAALRDAAQAAGAGLDLAARGWLRLRAAMEDGLARLSGWCAALRSQMTALPALCREAGGASVRALLGGRNTGSAQPAAAFGGGLWRLGASLMPLAGRPKGESKGGYRGLLDAAGQFLHGLPRQPPATGRTATIVQNVSITVSGANADAREIARQVRRELRRATDDLRFGYAARGGD